jgi:Tol biopolymer transport system component/enterochelin esterase-like enzyme
MVLNSLFTTRYSKKAFGLFAVASLFSSSLSAQGTLQDYQRAEDFNGKMQHAVYNAPDKVQWIEGQNKFVYGVLTPEGNKYIKVDASDQSRTPAFDQAKLAASLSAATGKTITAGQLELTDLNITKNGTQLEFTTQGKTWTCSLADYQCKEFSRPARRFMNDDDNTNLQGRKIKSPDNKWFAYTKGYNVYIQSAANQKEEYQLSFDGSEGDYYSPFMTWSPDGQKLATNKIRPSKPHMVYLIESSPTDQLQPKLHGRNYLKPGDALEQKQPSLFIVSTKKQVQVDPVLIAEQYNLTQPVWRKDSRAFTFEYNKRGHQEYKVMEVNATSGQVNTLIKETSKTFINYSGRNYRYDVADGKEIIWASERDGWNHLYLYDGEGKLKNQITKGDWLVRKVIQVDEKNRQVIFEGSGRNADQDPYFIQYYRVNFDGSGLKALTAENGNHKGVFSADFSYFTDTYSRVDMAPVTVLRNAADGKIITTLEKGDISPLLKTGWKLPEVFTAKGRDGKTDIWGIIIRPSNFDPAKKYPVIEYIYAGPQDSFVPKNFVTDSRGSLHEMAELGFIIVQIDGMGTANRSKAFHDVCWKDLGDAGFPDRIAWIKSAAKKYSYMDTEKVGIWGNSAGGQNSLGALLFHPEFYKVAVSSSGCHDNRMDKIWWNEQWMGYPIGPQYDASSNVTNAHKLQGKLLLILGELDENVDPSSTIQVINQLVKANKNFDFLEIPGMGHSLGGDYGEHKRRDFFVKNLLGVNPPEWTWKQNITVAKP